MYLQEGICSMQLVCSLFKRVENGVNIVIISQNDINLLLII